uniref:cytochrome b561 and DOMON domain-containing protein At5g35735-like n=1 Tax=Erigeron canadensis TaxID=72917 RepID=UPI001CB9027A|nr:cytochrome b561 and DOMON domain-containing protein At5g35735-like [Erigeron canadensis]
MGSKILSILLLIFISNIAISHAQNCGTYSFTSNTIYRACVSLPVLNSHLHWNFNANRTVDVAFRHTGSTTSQWVAWALNLRGRGMINSQALVAVTRPNGSVEAYRSSVDSFDTTLTPSRLSFEVPVIRAERVDGDVIIYATLVLPNGPTTSFTHVWQVGPVNNNGVPSTHNLDPPNRSSVGTVDFSSGQTGAGGSVGGSRQRRRNTHGVLSAVSWGVLMPMGVMVARYLKVFKVGNPAWFYLHAAIQTSAYGVGVAGWATGLKLGGDSVGIKYNTHRNIGITLFVFATLQVFALLLRPKPDNKYRIYWNFYHQGLGYSVIILSIINVYKGLDILDPEKKWKHTYTGIIIALGAIAVVFEALTWFIVLKRKKEDKRTHAGANGSYGANGSTLPL